MPTFNFTDSDAPSSMTPVRLTLANYEIQNDSKTCLIEARTIWLEYESKHSKLGIGLNADTGLRVDSEVDVTVLGFGFKVGREFGVKLPFFSVFWRIHCRRKTD